jgi:aldoxime dehydratase
MPRSPSTRMPDGWSPPLPAWSADFGAGSNEIVIAYFGAQTDSGNGDEFRRLIAGFCGESTGPRRLEYAEYTDQTDRRTILCIAHWTDAQSYGSWFASGSFSRWWNDPDRRSGDTGYFREVLTIPTERFETIFSSRCPAGMGMALTSLRGPIVEHGYWGSMRDRIPVSQTDDLAGCGVEVHPVTRVTDSEERRLRVTIPGDLAVIRSGQDWSACGDEELALYESSVRPALDRAMRYLNSHPGETGCCEMRFARETNADGSLLPQTFGLGYFLTLAHLERWAECHPTHLAIFNSFVEMFGLLGAIELRLWHEVAVLPASGQVFEYINCHPRTGMLPYFPTHAF